MVGQSDAKREAASDPIPRRHDGRAANRENVGRRARATNATARLSRRGHVRYAIQHGKRAGFRTVKHRSSNSKGGQSLPPMIHRGE
jgi:hypothetical protein